MSKSILRILSVGLVIVAIFALAGTAQAASTLTAAEATANVVASTDDGSQSAATSTTVANVVEVKAMQTIKVATTPASTTESITVGACVITFASSSAGVQPQAADSTSCASDAATVYIHTVTGSATTTRTTAQMATVIGALTDVYDVTHGWLAVAASTTDVSYVNFTATSTETAASPDIVFTADDVKVVTSDKGGTRSAVIAVAQKQTVTLGGTFNLTDGGDAGDIYALNSSAFHATYTVTSSDTSSTTVAAALSSAIHAASGYSSAGFTSASAYGVVTLTASAAGTAFTLATTTATDIGTAAVKQVVTFTPAGTNKGETYTITLNGTDYSYTALVGTVADVIAGLQGALNGNSAADCTEDGAVITCTAKTAGTALSSYSTSITAATPTASSGGSSVVSGGSGTPAVIIPTTVAPVPTILPSTNFIFTRVLSYGTQNNEVLALQNRLAAEGLFSVQATGYFGPVTQAAVKAYQKLHGIDSIGIVGPATRAELNKEAVANPTATIASLLQQVKDLQVILAALIAKGVR